MVRFWAGIVTPLGVTIPLYFMRQSEDRLLWVKTGRGRLTSHIHPAGEWPRTVEQTPTQIGNNTHNQTLVYEAPTYEYAAMQFLEGVPPKNRSIQELRDYQ